MGRGRRESNQTEVCVRTLLMSMPMLGVRRLGKRRKETGRRRRRRKSFWKVTLILTLTSGPSLRQASTTQCS